MQQVNRFAAIDIETIWCDGVAFIGVAIAGRGTFEFVDKRYYILTPFKNHGSMNAYALYAGGIKLDLEYSRESTMSDLRRFLTEHEDDAMFAYNAAFDYRHLPELSLLTWYDIMKLAAYGQHNPRILSQADCYKTGRLKRGYGVESVYRMLSENNVYRELHNALTDAIGELGILRLLNH